MASTFVMDKLQSMVAASAIHDGKRGKEDYTDVCHPGTREEYLENLRAWAEKAPEEMRVQWASAIAGAGKTAMLRTFCTSLEEQRGFPPISFFIWKNDLLRNTLDRFPATIAAQLCRRIPALVPYVEKAINEDSFLLQSAFKKQMDKLVISPLLNACDVIKGEHHLIFVVDGLDELDAEGQTVFLNFIPYFLSRLTSLPISLLVSSRPEEMIVGAFNHPELASITRATRIGASDKDIWKLINDKFNNINLRFPYLRIRYGGRWPSDEQLATMVKQSSGLFIWPTVAINYIDKVALGLDHNKRLEQVLSSAEPKPWIASPLDNLYRAILQAHAPEDPEDLLRFNQRLAYFCLPVGIDTFILEEITDRVVDWTDTPIRAVFDETLDELWSSVAGLSSLFSPRTTLTTDESPTPGISHRSLRDFTFNWARCGGKFYYSSEREVHAEIVCKFLKFFNTRQAYQSRASMSAQFIERAGIFIGSHLKEAIVAEELGRCMDDVMLDYIPPTWPLVTQIFTIVRLFDGLYKLADNPEFPDGSQRRQTFLSKLEVFFKDRAANAEEWDIALFRLAFSTANFKGDTFSYHSVHCWHVHRSAHCACLDAFIRNIRLHNYQDILGDSTLFQHAKSRLPPHRKDDIAKDSFDVLRFIVSLSETSPWAIQLSSFIPAIDHWIISLLKHCPPNDDLYNTLGRICTAPLPDLPKREGDCSWELVKQFLSQTEEFDAYTKRCREAGIETNFPRIRIPDDWWGDKWTREELLKQGYKPSFEIPSDWWEDEDIREELLKQGYVRPTPTSQPIKLLGSAAPQLSSSQLQSLLLSSSGPPSITPSFGIVLDAPASDVDDVLHASLPIDPSHAGPTPAPATVPAEEVVVSKANSTSAGDVEDTGTTLPTVIPSHSFSQAIPVPDSTSGTNGSVSEVGAQPLGQRRRGRARTFFKKLIRRP